MISLIVWVILLPLPSFQLHKYGNKLSISREIGNQTINDDIFIAVRTTEKFHQNRLQVILNTWYNLAPEKVRLVKFTYLPRYLFL